MYGYKFSQNLTYEACSGVECLERIQKLDFEVEKEQKRREGGGVRWGNWRNLIEVSPDQPSSILNQYY